MRPMTPSLKLILRHLERVGPSTYGELRAVIRLGIKQTRKLVHQARDARLVHRCGWCQVPGTNHKMVWKIGPGTDAVRPLARDRRERMRAYYTKNQLILRQKQRQWYRNNRERKIAATHAWQAANPARALETHRRYMAKRKLALAKRKLALASWT